MFFDLINVSATFQTLMNSILRSYIDKFVLVYLDDILVYFNSEEEHLEHLRIVFDTLRKHSLYAKLNKCVFDQLTIEFCDHLVGQEVVKVLDSKVKTVENIRTATSINENYLLYLY